MGEVIGYAGVLIIIHYLSAVHQAARAAYIDCGGKWDFAEAAALYIISQILHKVPEKHCHNKPTGCIFFFHSKFLGCKH